MPQTTHSSGCGAWHVECWPKDAKWTNEHYAMGDPAAIRHVEDLLAENERLREQLRDRSAYLDWLVNEVCPYHNLECVDVGCPATPPGR
jgi:hypothetical protein